MHTQPPNLTALPTPDKDKLRASLDALHREMPAMIELARVMGQLRFEQYRAYTSAGFSREEALQLVVAAVSGGQVCS